MSIMIPLVSPDVCPLAIVSLQADCILDFFKTFDRVCHEGLMSNSLLSGFLWLPFRRYHVSSANEPPSSESMRFCLEGSMLGPALYLLLISDLVSTFNPLHRLEEAITSSFPILMLAKPKTISTRIILFSVHHLVVFKDYDNHVCFEVYRTSPLSTLLKHPFFLPPTDI